MLGVFFFWPVAHSSSAGIFPAELGECCTLDLPGEGTETLQTTADTKHSQAHLPEIPESQNLRICWVGKTHQDQWAPASVQDTTRISINHSSYPPKIITQHQIRVEKILKAAKCMGHQYLLTSCWLARGSGWFGQQFASSHPLWGRGAGEKREMR